MKQLLSINKAAKILNVHPNTLKRWDKSGELHAIRIGSRGDRRYLQSDINKYILEKRLDRKIYPTVGPHVAVAVIVFKDNKILIGKRTAEMGRGEYCFPGGSIALGESFEECALNESMNKANIKISPPIVFCVTNNRKYIPKIQRQGVTIGAYANYISGKVKTGRPNRIANFKWYQLENLPKPLFEADSKILKCYLDKKFYID